VMYSLCGAGSQDLIAAAATGGESRYPAARCRTCEVHVSRSSRYADETRGICTTSRRHKQIGPWEPSMTLASGWYGRRRGGA
jgi:hypothetical protein